MNKHLLFLILLITTNAAVSQSKLSFNGYIKELSMYYKPVETIPVSATDSLNYLFLNQIHNRLNFRWDATKKLTFDLEIRNRLFFGQMVKKFPAYEEMINQDGGFIDLGVIVVSADSWFLHSSIDRAWIDYTFNKLQARIGRQRINWGINLVWNPNDIFNTFSYFELNCNILQAKLHRLNWFTKSVTTMMKQLLQACTGLLSSKPISRFWVVGWGKIMCWVVAGRATSKVVVSGARFRGLFRAKAITEVTKQWLPLFPAIIF